MIQKDALELLKMGYSVYLTGEAGSGKTYLLNKYISFLRKYKVEVAITATTGIAATHLGGVTIDSWSGLGIRDDVSESEVHVLAENRNVSKRIQKAKVLIIDEVSMLHGRRLDSIDKICRSVRADTSPFGGLQVIMTGDFFQLPPVSEERHNYDYVYKSNVWREMNPHVLYLESQYRQKDPVFNEVLTAIRTNSVDQRIKNILSETSAHEFKGQVVPAKLYTHNVDVDEINKRELEKIKEESREYTMVSVGYDGLVESLKRGCLAPESLVLKKGAQVMFVRNNHKMGYFNGTVGKVIGFDRDGNPIVQTYEGLKIHVERARWNIIEDNKVRAEIIQYPLRLAWAITVHKSQGMTLSCAEIDLSKSFVHGMGYVALSRVRSLSGVRLLGINEMALMVNPEITEYDRSLRMRSAETVTELKQMNWFQKFFKKRNFLYKLTS